MALAQDVTIDYARRKFGRVGKRLGRPPDLKHLLTEANVRLEGALPDLFVAAINKALVEIPVVCPHCNGKFDVPGGGSENMITYLLDRRLGKPRIQVDSHVIQASVSMTPADYARLSGELAKFRAGIAGIDDTQLLCQSGETERKTEVIEAATEIAQCDDYAI